MSELTGANLTFTPLNARCRHSHVGALSGNIGDQDSEQ